MKEGYKSSVRKWGALIAAVILYYFIHEGSHLVFALIYGAFEKIRILGLGIQVVAETRLMTDIQKFIFCSTGSVATLSAAYLLAVFHLQIIKHKSRILRAVSYYTTICFLLIDPLYLSIFYKFVGGGDMNGIILSGIPESAVSLIFGIIALINILLIIKVIYPAYKTSFAPPQDATNNL